MDVATYTGPERRWMTSRPSRSWLDRDEHFYNRVAREMERHIAILEKMRKRAKGEASSALWSGIYELQNKLHEYRKDIARECAPWFGETE